MLLEDFKINGNFESIFTSQDKNRICKFSKLFTNNFSKVDDLQKKIDYK